MNGAALFLCDHTGNMARPWAEAGFACWCVDIRHSIRRDRKEGNIRFARAVFLANNPMMDRRAA